MRATLLELAKGRLNRYYCPQRLVLVRSGFENNPRCGNLRPIQYDISLICRAEHHLVMSWQETSRCKMIGLWSPRIYFSNDAATLSAPSCSS
jgi:hypothetical protein